MESNISAVADAFTAYLANLQNQPAWWYGVAIDPNDKSSLCHLLQLEPATYELFLRSQGFLTHQGISKDKIENFANANAHIQYTCQQWMGSISKLISSVLAKECQNVAFQSKNTT